MGKLIRLRSTIARPADATAYAAGDEISNSATPGSVVRAVFDLSGFTRGRILAATLDVTPASGSLVITAFDASLMIFRTPDAPAAVGDNVTNPIAAAVRTLAIGDYRFDDGGWVNQLGALTAGTSGVQKVPATVSTGLATPVLQDAHGPGHFFDFTGQLATQRQLTAVLNALAAWTPTAVVNTFGITLDIEAE